MFSWTDTPTTRIQTFRRTYSPNPVGRGRGTLECPLGDVPAGGDEPRAEFVERLRIEGLESRSLGSRSRRELGVGRRTNSVLCACVDQFGEPVVESGFVLGLLVHGRSGVGFGDDHSAIRDEQVDAEKGDIENVRDPLGEFA